MKRLFLLPGFLVLFSMPLLSAGFNGTWTIQSVDGDGRTVKAEITFREEGGALKASLQAGAERREIERITHENESVRFEIPWENETVFVSLEAAGDSLKGRWRTGDADGPITGERTGAGIGGVWKLTAVRPNGGTSDAEMELTREGAEWKGVMRSDETGSMPLRQVNATADQLQFQVDSPRGLVKIDMTLRDGVLKGTWSTTDQVSGSIEGRR